MFAANLSVTEQIVALQRTGLAWAVAGWLAKNFEPEFPSGYAGAHNV